MPLVRYVGNQPVSFVHRGVSQGDEFLIPDDQVEAYTRRVDIVLAEPDSLLPPAEPADVADVEAEPEPLALAPYVPTGEAPTTAPQEG